MVRFLRAIANLELVETYRLAIGQKPTLRERSQSLQGFKKLVDNPFQAPISVRRD